MKPTSTTEPNTASQRAYDYVRGKLEDGEYTPGTRLVTRTLAKEIGSSLNPVREALSRLSTQGLIDHVPGSGAYVRQPDQREISELYSLREAIESHAASLAATRIQDHELDELTEICQGWQRLASEMQSRPDEPLGAEPHHHWIETEARFHRIVIAAARNELMARVCSEHRVLSGIFGRQLERAVPVTAQLVARVAESHMALVDSLRAGDAEAARSQTAAMIQLGCREMNESR